MKQPPPGDPLARLGEQQVQILDLLDTYARLRRDPGHSMAEATRMTQLIFTLLRVQEALESALLQPALARGAGAEHPVLAEGAAYRSATMGALEHAEAVPVRDPGQARDMAALARRARIWFDYNDASVFGLARQLAAGQAPSRSEDDRADEAEQADVPLDLAALDRALAARQEALLSAGPVR